MGHYFGRFTKKYLFYIIEDNSKYGDYVIYSDDKKNFEKDLFRNFTEPYFHKNMNTTIFNAKPIKKSQ